MGVISMDLEEPPDQLRPTLHDQERPAAGDQPFEPDGAEIPRGESLTGGVEPRLPPPTRLRQIMAIDTFYVPPVEWNETMPMMDWLATGHEATWILPRCGDHVARSRAGSRERGRSSHTQSVPHRQLLPRPE